MRRRAAELPRRCGVHLHDGTQRLSEIAAWFHQLQQQSPKEQTRERSWRGRGGEGTHDELSGARSTLSRTGCSVAKITLPRSPSSKPDRQLRSELKRPQRQPPAASSATVACPPGRPGGHERIAEVQQASRSRSDPHRRARSTFKQAWVRSSSHQRVAGSTLASTLRRTRRSRRALGTVDGLAGATAETHARSPPRPVGGQLATCAKGRSTDRSASSHRDDTPPALQETRALGVHDELHARSASSPNGDVNDRARAVREHRPCRSAAANVSTD